MKICTKLRNSFKAVLRYQFHKYRAAEGMHIPNVFCREWTSSYNNYLQLQKWLHILGNKHIHLLSGASRESPILLSIVS